MSAVARRRPRRTRPGHLAVLLGPRAAGLRRLPSVRGLAFDQPVWWLLGLVVVTGAILLVVRRRARSGARGRRSRSRCRSRRPARAAGVHDVPRRRLRARHGRTSATWYSPGRRVARPGARAVRAGTADRGPRPGAEACPLARRHPSPPRRVDRRGTSEQRTGPSSPARATPTACHRRTRCRSGADVPAASGPRGGRDRGRRRRSLHHALVRAPARDRRRGDHHGRVRTDRARQLPAGRVRPARPRRGRPGRDGRLDGDAGGVDRRGAPCS